MHNFHRKAECDVTARWEWKDYWCSDVHWKAWERRAH